MKSFKDNEICVDCKDQFNCSSACNILTSNSLATDYKDVIDEIQAAREKRLICYIEDIEVLQDTRHKAVCAMMFFGISVEEIAKLIKKSPRRVYQILKEIEAKRKK